MPGNVIQVDAGYWFACALTSDHRAYCWGDNTHGQLGSLVTDTEGKCFRGGRCSPIPAEVFGGRVWREISAGEQHACGLTMEGEVYCWGSRAEGRLGRFAGQEICRNESATWPDAPCSSLPIHVGGGAGGRAR